MEYVVFGLQFIHDEQVLTYLETVFGTISWRFDLSARDLGHVMMLLQQRDRNLVKSFQTLEIGSSLLQTTGKQSINPPATVTVSWLISVPTSTPYNNHGSDFE